MKSPASDTAIIVSALAAAAVGVGLVWWRTGPLGALLIGLPISFLVALVVVLIRVGRRT